jgi:hypothetical protein
MRIEGEIEFSILGGGGGCHNSMPGLDDAEHGRPKNSTIPASNAISIPAPCLVHYLASLQMP